ncbi:hypothetical protein LTR53_013416, partial [Teratosphaeriaceae sp. CCFEE 6253]
HFDCIVIGSGQAGTPLATALAQSGRKTALVERSHIGGCCVNEGCTPTKTMIASGRVAYLAGRAGDYGVWQSSRTPTYAALRGHPDGTTGPFHGAEKVAPVIDMVKVRQRKHDIVERFRGGSEARLKTIEGLEVVMGDAVFTAPNTLAVTSADGGKLSLEAEAFFINTGERPLRPHLDGLEDILAGEHSARVLDSTSIQELGEVPKKLVVLGGGYIGLEFGQLFRGLGSQVTVVQRAAQLAPREDAEVAAELRKICEEDGMEILTNAQAKSLHSEPSGTHPLVLTCAITSDGSTTEKQVAGSHILLAIGRTPNTDTLGLPAAGVAVNDRGHITVNPTLQTSAPHIYALGDCHGGPAFTHTAYDDFRLLRANLIDAAEPQLSTTGRMLPYVMYTDPQLGHIGLHEHEARRAFPDRRIQTATMPMSRVARALETAETRGLMKAVVDGDSGEILGFTCLGIEGGEVMSLVQVAMMGGLPYTRSREAVFAHPTLAESLNNLWGYLK